MAFFGIQVLTGREARFVSAVGNDRELSGVQLFWPRRSLRIRKAGIWRDSVAPIFPGYVFLKASGVPPGLFVALRHVPGFIRFLPANDDIEPLNEKDQDLLSHFIAFGEVVQKSKAVFDENQRIKIIAGPLKDLEGSIVKVDKRKGRARVRLEMYKDAFEVDFGFEAMDAAPPAQK
jgi:transcription termination/antitermination protein NusG